MDNDLLRKNPPTADITESTSTEQHSKSEEEPESDVILKFEASDAVLTALILFFLLVRTHIPDRVLLVLQNKEKAIALHHTLYLQVA